MAQIGRLPPAPFADDFVTSFFHVRNCPNGRFRNALHPVLDFGCHAAVFKMTAGSGLRLRDDAAGTAGCPELPRTLLITGSSARQGEVLPERM
jgi:hypothetical protein